MLKVVFMGTPALAAHSLKALVDHDFKVSLVFTQPDRPQGRGKKIGMSAVKSQALDLGLEVFQPESLKAEGVLERIKAAQPDVIVVAAYGKILPEEILNLAPLGCLNIHASLLPQYRGAAPIQWVLLDGQKETGISIMRMEKGLDTGPVLLQKKMVIPEDMDGGELYQALTEMGADALLETLPLWAAGQLEALPQKEEAATYAPRILREHEKLDWCQPAQTLLNQIRAFSPWPGAYGLWQDKEIKIIKAKAVPPEDLPEDTETEGVLPGTILAIPRKQGPVIQTGQGALQLILVRPVGKKEMDASSFLNGNPMEVGQCWH